MKYFLDTEFYEDGRTIDLISIGVVAEDGREFYAVSKEAELHRVSEWVRTNVLPQLPPYSHPAWKTRSEIRDGLMAFVRDDGKTTPEVWTYYGDYDWVAVAQLFGTMMHLPSHFPMFAMDLKQLAVMKGNRVIAVMTGGEHNALEDARWNRKTYDALTALP